MTTPNFQDTPINSLGPSMIRTYTPMLVGFLVSWLVSSNIIDEATSQTAAAALTTGLTALISGLYYTLVRLLERKNPLFGMLLGSTRQPTYIQGEVVKAVTTAEAGKADAAALVAALESVPADVAQQAVTRATNVS